MSSSSFRLLHQLPEELLQDILPRLDAAALKSLSLASKGCYRLALPLLWRQVVLTDCETVYDDSTDEHDDTPLIRKLIILATRPEIAACVKTLIHRCHLPPPAIFHELPLTPFSSQTLSIDPRTTRLVQAAVEHMVNVTTLRIIFGHPTLSDALLRCFFSRDRRRRVPVKRLWLENCRISSGCCLSIDSHPYGLPLELDFRGLESIRLRRMPLRPGSSWPGAEVSRFQYVYARDGESQDLEGGMGVPYSTAIHALHREQSVDLQRSKLLIDDPDTAKKLLGIPDDSPDTPSELEGLYEQVFKFDDRLYDRLLRDVGSGVLPAFLTRDLPSRRERASLAYRGCWLDPLCSDERDGHRRGYDHDQFTDWEWLQFQREKLPSARVALSVFNSASESLTSLNLDWVLTKPRLMGGTATIRPQRLWVAFFADLFGLRFRHLRAFQFRNTVVSQAVMPNGLYLLDHSDSNLRDPPSATQSPDVLDCQSRLDTACLRFMEAHSNLQCLAWPMDHFFSTWPLRADIADRAQAVIENLGKTLVDLRLDALYTFSWCEQQTEDVECRMPANREHRRRFIEHFAPYMRNLESIKIEGSIPRDERREIIKALHACPLKKIVNIGINFPLGNTWGPDGRDLVQRPDDVDIGDLEGENKEAVWHYGMQKPETARAASHFEAQYGWPPSPPIIHTIASYHASTITELKFCGPKGSPVLLTPTPITTPLLNALQHFHQLRSLVVSVWFSTSFEGSARDAEVVSYWTDCRSPRSTALVRVADDEPPPWEKELRTKYAPDALAARITRFIGAFLSEQAKARKGGVHVRATICVGEVSGIFDVDLWIGKDEAAASDVCLGFQGPKAEVDPDRRDAKLERRHWF